jgi:hypothetical protein
LRQRVALVATLARLYVGVVLIDRERECRGHRRRIVGVVYDHMCQQQCDQRIGYAAGLRPGNMSQIGARSAYLALRDFDPANVSCGVNFRPRAASEVGPLIPPIADMHRLPWHVRLVPEGNICKQGTAS